jgi:hypothetical protein
VGTSDAQTLTNKDLSSGTNTFPSSLATDAEVTSAVSAHNASSGVHGVTGSVVGTTDAQTLTNKTLALGSNTVSGTKAQFNAAMTDDDFATLTGAETLTNKDLSSGTNTFPAETDRFHRYKSAAAQAIGTGAGAIVVLDGATALSGITWDAGTNTATIVNAGLYLVTAHAMYYDGGAARRDIALTVEKNGSTLITSQGGTTAQAQAISLEINQVVSLAATDTIRLRAVAGSSGGQLNNGADLTYLQITRLA